MSLGFMELHDGFWLCIVVRVSIKTADQTSKINTGKLKIKDMASVLSTRDHFCNADQEADLAVNHIFLVLALV